MILYLAAQAVVMTPVTAPPPPPMTVMSTARRQDVRLTLDVRVDGDGGKLFEGPLRIASNNSTTIRREQSEPAEIQCERPFPASNATHSLNLSLAPVYTAASTPDGSMMLSVTVRWTRPSEPVCGTRQGVRVVELSDSVLLRPGRDVVLTGDGGLRVRLQAR